MDIYLFIFLVAKPLHTLIVFIYCHITLPPSILKNTFKTFRNVFSYSDFFQLQEISFSLMLFILQQLRCLLLFLFGYRTTRVSMTSSSHSYKKKRGKKGELTEMCSRPRAVNPRAHLYLLSVPFIASNSFSQHPPAAAH